MSGARRRAEEQGYYGDDPRSRRQRVQQVEWQPMCAGCSDLETLLLGPNPHPCRRCGTPTTDAVRVVR